MIRKTVLDVLSALPTKRQAISLARALQKPQICIVQADHPYEELENVFQNLLSLGHLPVVALRHFHNNWNDRLKDAYSWSPRTTVVADIDLARIEILARKGRFGTQSHSQNPHITMPNCGKILLLDAMSFIVIAKFV